MLSKISCKVDENQLAPLLLRVLPEYSEEDIQGIGKIMIEHMKATTKLDSIDKILIEDEWVGKLKVWRESTSTSPSNMHLGHHKSLIYTFDDNDMIDKKESRWTILNSPDGEDNDSEDDSEDDESIYLTY